MNEIYIFSILWFKGDGHIQNWLFQAFQTKLKSWEYC